ncbi:MAG TPA: aldo/keto reductase [Limnochordia bacterium]|nr:aldo/keto reductase [Limnochordia bacterium]
MLRREYGKTGEQLSIVGFGGIVVTDTEPSEAARLVAEAVDRGINYFDVAPSYGNAEERLGPALKPHRSKAFLACKTGKRDAAGARAELERSLGLLQTDHFDVYQLHGMTSEEDYQKAMGPGGALETFVKAREEGKVRFLGFSAHSVEIALKLMDAFDFDSILFPFNWVNFFNADFGPQVLETALKKGVARLALKGMAMTRWEQGEDRSYKKCWYRPIDDPALADLAWRWTLSQPITAAVPPGDAKLFKLALDIAERFKPLSADEGLELRRRAEGLKPIFELQPA